MKVIRWIVLVAIVFLMMGAMGVATYNVYAQGPTPTPCVDDSVHPVSNGQTGITRERAEEIARAQHPGSNVRDTELESENGILLYSVKLDNGAEVELDASDGTVLPAEPENSAADGCDERDDDAEDARESNDVNEQDPSDETAPANTGITAEEAKKIAAEANPGTTALEVDFDREGGHDMWEVELSNNIEVEVDANSGAILATKRDD